MIPDLLHFFSKVRDIPHVIKAGDKVNPHGDNIRIELAMQPSGKVIFRELNVSMSYFRQVVIVTITVVNGMMLWYN